MAKSTFYNLSDEKKDRIFDAALREFSVRTFSQASLNQIIKNAGIPKGSFYQYFDNKEDLYLYVLEVAAKDNREILSRIRKTDSDADVFEVIMNETREVLEQAKVRPEYVEMSMLIAMDNSEFIMNIRKSSTDNYVKLVERDKARDLIKPEADSELIINMISTFSHNEYFRIGSDKEKFLKTLGDAIKIIKGSVSVSKG